MTATVAKLYNEVIKQQDETKILVGQLSKKDKQISRLEHNLSQTQQEYKSLMDKYISIELDNEELLREKEKSENDQAMIKD